MVLSPELVPGDGSLKYVVLSSEQYDPFEIILGVQNCIESEVYSVSLASLASIYWCETKYVVLSPELVPSNTWSYLYSWYLNSNTFFPS